MITAIVVLRLFAASQVLFCAGALAMSQNPLRIRMLGAVLALAVVSYLVLPLVFTHVGPAAGKVFVPPADVIPPLLLLFAWELFEDDRKLPLTLWLLGWTYIAVTSLVELAWDPTGATAATYLAVFVQIVKFGFAGGAIFIVWRGRENDLIETRLKLRRVFAVGLGLIVAAVVVTELVTGWRVPKVIELYGERR